MAELHRRLRIGLIADTLTATCLKQECEIVELLPHGFVDRIRTFKPDFILVESAWHGADDAWRYRVASHNRKLSWRKIFDGISPSPIRKLVKYCKRVGIPTVFWNKEDSAHFSRFIHHARLFDFIYTVDVNAVGVYRSFAPDARHIDALTFPIQPQIHYPRSHWHNTRLNFVGSFSAGVHSARRQWQLNAFKAARVIGVDAYDRNHGKTSANYRFPAFENLDVRTGVSHERTADIYSSHVASLNVNTVTDSPTMFSRRLVEIMACEGLAVSNDAASIRALFPDLVCVVENKDEMEALFDQLRSGRTRAQEDMAKAGRQAVIASHTYGHFLSKVVGDIGHMLGAR